MDLPWTKPSILGIPHLWNPPGGQNESKPDFHWISRPRGARPELFDVQPTKKGFTIRPLFPGDEE